MPLLLTSCANKCIMRIWYICIWCVYIYIYKYIVLYIIVSTCMDRQVDACVPVENARCEQAHSDKYAHAQDEVRLELDLVLK